MLPYKYSQLPNERLTYEEALKMCKPERKNVKGKRIKMGQLKLFYAELLFLTKYAMPGDKVLYIGAAPGYHTNKMAELFPKITFDLYDKTRFDIHKRYTYSKQITLFNQYFTDETVRKYQNSNQRILLMCDLRNLDIGELQKIDDHESMDILVSDDMLMQMRWCKMIKPAQSLLKFRLPYGIERTRYLTGTIYLQAYNRISTEARLCTNDYESTIAYDNKLFDEKLAYLNGKIRCGGVRYPKWEKITSKYKIENNWDNCLALKIIYNYQKKYNKDKPTIDSVGKMFIDVIEFHKNRYGVKYDVVFEK